MRALSKLPCARATTVLGLEHFRAETVKVGVPCQDHLRECSRRAVYRRASKHQTVGKSWHFFWGGGCRATAAPARRSMASAEIARINGLDILASDLRGV